MLGLKEVDNELLMESMIFVATKRYPSDQRASLRRLDELLDLRLILSKMTAGARINRKSRSVSVPGTTPLFRTAGEVA